MPDKSYQSQDTSHKTFQNMQQARLGEPHRRAPPCANNCTQDVGLGAASKAHTPQACSTRSGARRGAAPAISNAVASLSAYGLARRPRVSHALSPALQNFSPAIHPVQIHQWGLCCWVPPTCPRLGGGQARGTRGGASRSAAEERAAEVVPCVAGKGAGHHEPRAVVPRATRDCTASHAGLHRASCARRA